MTQFITLIGYGAIAQSVCTALADDAHLKVTQILVRPGKSKTVQALLPKGITAIENVTEIAPKTDFVLECAGHQAVADYGPSILERGMDLGLVSVGCLADDALFRRLRDTAQAHQSRAVVLPGAIGGVDALAAAGPALTQVSYSARKPPLSWRGSPAEQTHDLELVDAPTSVYRGSARAAALGFPKNANVVATVALAGIGFDATTVDLIADPSATGNSHHIIARGSGFDLSFSTAGAALPSNPKTSALTALSVLRAIRHRGHGLLV